MSKIWLRHNVSGIVVVYLATALAFLSQVIRDITFIKYSEGIEAQLYSQLYLSQMGLSFLTNIILFKQFGRRDFYLLSLMIGLLTLFLLTYLSNFYAGAFLFLFLGISSALLGNILLFSDRLFLSRSREFFVHLAVLGLVLFFNLIYYYSVAITIGLLLLLAILSQKKRTMHDGLKMVSAFLFSLPSLVVQYLFYLLSLTEYYALNPLILRAGIYANAILLVPLILIKSVALERKIFLKKQMVRICVGFVFVSIFGLIFLRQWYLPIFIGVFFAFMTYLVALNEFIKNTK